MNLYIVLEKEQSSGLATLDRTGMHHYIGNLEVSGWDTSEPYINLSHLPKSLPSGMDEERHVDRYILEANGPAETAPPEGIYEEDGLYGTVEVNQKGWYLRMEGPSLKNVRSFYTKLRRKELTPNDPWSPSSP